MSKKQLWIFIIASVVGSVLGSYVVKHGFRLRTKPTSAAVLRQTCETFNQQLPMQLDAVTRIDATYPGPGDVLNYRCSILGHKASELDATKLREAIEPQARQNYRTNPDMESLRKMSVTLKYHYYDEDGVFIVAFAVSP